MTRSIAALTFTALMLTGTSAVSGQVVGRFQSWTVTQFRTGCVIESLGEPGSKAKFHFGPPTERKELQDFSIRQTSSRLDGNIFGTRENLWTWVSFKDVDTGETVEFGAHSKGWSVLSLTTGLELEDLKRVTDLWMSANEEGHLVSISADGKAIGTFDFAGLAEAFAAAKACETGPSSS